MPVLNTSTYGMNKPSYTSMNQGFGMNSMNSPYGGGMNNMMTGQMLQQNVLKSIRMQLRVLNQI